MVAAGEPQDVRAHIMDITQFILLVLALAAIGAWAMNIWGGWAEMVYEKQKGSALAWYWLRLMGITTSRENCVRFIKIVSTSGIVLLSIGLVAGFLIGRGLSNRKGTLMRMRSNHPVNSDARGDAVPCVGSRTRAGYCER